MPRLVLLGQVLIDLPDAPTEPTYAPLDYVPTCTECGGVEATRGRSTRVLRCDDCGAMVRSDG